MEIIVPTFVGIGGIILGYLGRVIYGRIKAITAEKKAQQIIATAQMEADKIRKEAQIEVREIMDRERRNFDRETRDRKHELQVWERRLSQKEETIEHKLEIIERREKELQGKEKIISSKEQSLDRLKDELARIEKEQRKILEKIAGMTQEEAKKILQQSLEEETRRESALMLRRIEEEAKQTAERKAKEILSIAIQRVATEQTVDSTVTVIPVSDEIKGRIIGREGRNIRAFEQATGVDLIVDDTPETITISAFDSVRREIARISMEKLIADGRIHPARIEEVVNKVKQDMDNIIKETGEQAALEVGVVGLHTDILSYLGKLKYRTSFGQNQLQHTLEVARIAGIIAAELQADINFCKRAALLHDIGKAVNHEIEGTHHQISANIAQKYGESAKMINAILSHHEGIEQPQSIEAFILAAADAISASRPGARRESVEHYLHRIERLEKLALSFRGVVSAYAIQAGREIRVLVEPEEVDDNTIYILARDIAKKIEQELEYPGQIKVIVIRETRAQEVAK